MFNVSQGVKDLCKDMIEYSDEWSQTNPSRKDINYEID